MLDLAYLFDPRPGPLPSYDLQLYLALMALVAAGLGASIFQVFSRTKPSAMRWLLFGQVPVSLGVLLLTSARLLSIPYLSTRALLYGLATLSAVGWAAYLLWQSHQDGFLKRQLSLLTFSWQEEEPGTPVGASVVLLAGHIAGLLLLSVHLGRTYQYMAGLFLLLLIPQIVLSLQARKWILHLEALTPLWCAYLAAVARRLCAKLLSQPLPLYDGFASPELLSSLLNVEAVLLASVVYVLLCQGYLWALRHRRADRFAAYVGTSLALAVLVWAGTAYFRHRTHGVTANDPYGYAQMAVDLAEHGDPMHEFPLFPRVSHLHISWWPVVHYGYQVRVPPLRGDGRTASDWPPGWPTILSVGYLLLGEQGLYFVNPVIGLLCLLALLALMWELLYDRPWEERLLGGAFAAYCLATSYEHIDRLLVPMADASAQLFTVLALALVLRGARRQHRLHAVLAGICFGGAYAIRHTQLALGLCVAVALLSLGREWLTTRERWEFAGLFGLTSLLVAVPDLVYHQVVFGHFLTPESTELDLFSLSHIAATARLMWQRALSGNEFGFLAPLLLYGAYRMYAKKRGYFLVLLTAVLAVLAVHLPYAALRLRDLLSLFPLALAWVGYGAVELWKMIPVGRGILSYRRHVLGVSVILVLLVAPMLRTWHILPRAWGTYRASFGYVTPEERRAFDALAAHTEEPCVVGSSLNGGPIDLYAGRMAFRPALWSAAEFDVFLQQMFHEGTNVYLLDDGEAVQASLEHANAHYRVEWRAHLTVPIFGDPERISSALYQIEPIPGAPE